MPGNGYKLLKAGRKRRGFKRKSVNQLRKKQRDAHIRSICKGVISRRIENKHMTPLALKMNMSM